MIAKTVAQKARVKPGTTIAVLNPVPGVVESLGLPEDSRFVDPKEAGLVFLFVSSRAELDSRMPVAVEALAPDAAIWVFFRKGSKAAKLDMNRDDVWAVAERLWSAPTTPGPRSGSGGHPSVVRLRSLHFQAPPHTSPDRGDGM